MIALSLVLLALGGASSFGPFVNAGCSSFQARSSNLTQKAPSSGKKVIVQMFEWNWNSIAAECTNFLGPEGYGFVQVSPPSEHITGSQWWTDYQVVSYNLNSKRGNREQFQNMVNTCHGAGVGVIADTIWNHMAGIESGTGDGGSSFTHYVYYGTYQYQASISDFHHCGLRPNDDIVSYSDRAEVQTCELVNLADLATDTEYVRSRLAQYGNDLLSLGVDGLRLDAAKHIAASDIANIIGRLSRRPYITQEVIYGAGEPITPNEYMGNGDVQEFRYTSALKDAFLNGNIASLQDFGNRGWVSSDQANVFVANHDTERNGASLNYNSPNNAYILAQIFSLAHPYGTPTILSGYSFSNNDNGAPNGSAYTTPLASILTMIGLDVLTGDEDYGTCSSTGGSNGWLCQHRYVAISGMVAFRNAAGSSGITNWVSPSSSRIAFGRGSSAYIAINNSNDAWTASFSTSLPNGSYCDVISGKISSLGSCGGATITVSGGTFTASVYPRGAVAIYVR